MMVTPTCPHGNTFASGKGKEGFVYGYRTAMQTVFFLDWDTSGKCECKKRLQGVDFGLLLQDLPQTCKAWSIELLYDHAARIGSGGHSVRSLASDVLIKYNTMMSTGRAWRQWAPVWQTNLTRCGRWPCRR